MAIDNITPPGESLQPRLPFEPLFTIKDAAAAVGLKYWLLLRAVNSGDVPSFRFGNNRRRVRLSDIEAALTRTQSGEVGQ